jgi:hypothetical protein
MTTDHRRVDAELVQEVLLCERVVQQILEAVMTEHIGGAAPYERLVVPQDREGTFSTRKVKDVTEALCGDSPLRCVSCSCKVFVVHLLRNTFVKSFLA